jgi:hypothetical protein
MKDDKIPNQVVAVIVLGWKKNKLVSEGAGPAYDVALVSEGAGPAYDVAQSARHSYGMQDCFYHRTKFNSWRSHISIGFDSPSS